MAPTARTVACVTVGAAAAADEANVTAAVQMMSASDYDVCSQWNTLHGLVECGVETEFVSVCATPVQYALPRKVNVADVR